MDILVLISTDIDESNPSHITVNIDQKTLDSAKKITKSLKECGFSYAVKRFAVSYEMYIDSIDDEDTNDIINIDGVDLLAFQPEYKIDGAHLKVYSDGFVDIILNLKHSSEKLWGSVGRLHELQQRLDIATE
jgi:hypothetical protein